MIELNVKFQEQYKRLDALCKDIFSSKDGVSEYINEMENTEYQFSRYVYDWQDIYKQLKHLRWIRNRLAHEVGAFNDDLCNENDLKWLTNFYNSILNRTDPIAIVAQTKRTLIKQTEQKDNKQTTNPNKSTSNFTVPKNKTSTSLWDKIKNKLKMWFS